jgi:nitrite reductase/ring-hydroxylating ferredoxin subunit
MAPGSKIRYFLILLLYVIPFTACNKHNDVIPDVPVRFSLFINDPQFTDLQVFGGVVLVDSRTNNIGQLADGFRGNGIIVFAGVDEFYAYDRTCPHDYSFNELIEKVVIDPSNSLMAICPRCSTYYALSAGGTPVKGPGRYPLKNYRTGFDGIYVTVWN